MRYFRNEKLQPAANAQLFNDVKHFTMLTRSLIRIPMRPLLFGCLCGIVFSGCGKKAASSGPPTPTVITTLPEKRSVQVYEDFPGKVEPIESVDIKARVTGYLQEICFKEGAEVKKGDCLYKIDPREYQAEVDSATANLEEAQAKLAQATSDYERSVKLRSQTAISAQEAEKNLAEARGAQAGVRSAQATLDKTKLNLEYTQIKSPISGKISRTNVTEGNLVENGDSLTTVISQDPLYVYFDLPERVLLRWNELAKESPNADPTADTRVFVGLLNEKAYPREAKLDFADNQVNSGTGTLNMRAIIENPHRELQPGMYARVRVKLNTPRERLLVPERAVGVDQGQRFVYIVTADNKIDYRKVTPGQIYGGKLSILDGLQPEDRVVTEGLLALRNGLTVKPEAAPIAEEKSETTAAK